MRTELAALYESWRVFDLLSRTLDQLPRDYLVILNIARNLLEGNRIPGIILPENFMALIQRDRQTVYEKRLTTRKWKESTILPPESIDIKPISDLSELPRVLPPNRLLQVIAPDLFAYNALTGNLPVADPQKPRIATEEKSETLTELITSIKQGSSPRQQAYALMDASNSMRDNYKLVVAKAILLSYLVKAQEESARLYLRPFAGTPLYRTDCLIQGQFPILAERILKCGLYGDTHIGKALQTAYLDIADIDRETRGRRTKTEILLISDCETWDNISNPPEGTTLHTLHLRGGRERFHDPLGNSYFNEFYAIKAMSKTFTTIDTSDLQLPPAVEEAWLMKEEIDRLEEKHKDMKDLDQIERDLDFQERLERVKRLSEVYKKMYGNSQHNKAKQLHQQTAERAEKLSRQVNRQGIKERMMEKLKQLQNLKSKVAKKMKSLKLPKRPQLSGTLFDFRIKN